MPSRDLRLFLADILEAIDKVERYTAGLSSEAFEENDMVVDAVVRNLEIIGEAARQISPQIRERYTGIDWVAVIGFRNVVIHEYFDVDVDIVWTIATQRLDKFREIVQQILDDRMKEVEE